jgi:hypothetical protein
VSSQAKHYHGKHIPKVLNLLQIPDTFLFIEQGRKLVVTPFSRTLTILSDCPRSILGLSVIQKTSRWCVMDSMWGLDGLSEVKDAPGRSKTRLCLKLRVYTDCPCLGHGLFVTPFSAQQPLGKTTITFSSDVRIRWSWTLWKAHSEDYPLQLNVWPKTLWIKVELQTKIQHKPKASTICSTPLQMYQPHKCTTLSVSELAFSQTFFKGVFTLFAMPLDPSNITLLDRSSGTIWPICKQVCPSW